MPAQFCLRCPWHLLPICLGVTSIIGLFATYFLAKENCHIEKWLLPYVSYTGTEHPESSIFGLILNVEGFLGIVIVILAWRLVRHLRLKNELLNKITSITGFMGCFGVVIVANFQVSKNKVPHYIGASLALIIGTVYCCLASILSYKLRKSRTNFSAIICALRFVAAALMVLSFGSLIILAIQRTDFNKNYQNRHDKGNLSVPTNFKFPNGSCVPIRDYVPLTKQYIDLGMSICEWAITVCLLFSLSLYTYEFKFFDNVKIVLKRGGHQLTDLSFRGNNRASSVQNRPLMKQTSYSPNDLSCYSHCDKTRPLTEDSESDIICSSELPKCKNNNTETSCLQHFDFTDGKTVSKSLPDIPRNCISH